MRLHGLAVLAHILGVVAMFAGFAMQQRAGARLRRATSAHDARPWAELLDATRTMPPSGALMVLATGAYLSARFVGGEPPVWIAAGVVAAVVIGGVSLLLFNRDVKGIVATIGAGDAPDALSPDAAARLRRPRTWGALAAANGAALGALWVMTMKPGPLESAVAVALPIASGGLVGARLGRRAGAAHA